MDRKTTHEPLFSNMEINRQSLLKHYAVWIVCSLSFCSLQFTGNNHTKIYYIAQSLPDRLTVMANEKLEKDFEMGNMHMILMDKNMDGVQK